MNGLLQWRNEKVVVVVVSGLDEQARRAGLRNVRPRLRGLSEN